MALLQLPFETLITSGRFNGKDFDKGVEELSSGASRERMDELVKTAKSIHDDWRTELIDNSQKRNIEITDDFSLRFTNTEGEIREDDVTGFAYQQLCSRMGVPAQYVLKCYESGKKKLAMQNFREWADDYKGTLKVMRNNGQTRAVVTNSFSQWDSYKVLSNLKRTVNLDRWALVQSYLSEDKLVLRFIDSKSPIYEDANSKLYVGVCIRTSDVGNGALYVKMFVYRQACKNGMIISKGDATLYQQAHVGEAMSNSKLADFTRAMYRAEKYGETFAKAIDGCRKQKMSSLEFNLWVKDTLKLSKDNTEKLEQLIKDKYEPNLWGAINGVTELAQKFTLDRRIELEDEAGRLFGKIVL